MGRRGLNGRSRFHILAERKMCSKTIRRLRANMETKTLNKLCEALDCRLQDIAEYIPDK